MSCIVSYLTDFQVHMFTDRAFYSEDGKAAFFGGKCFQLHDHPIAISARGVANQTFRMMADMLNVTADSSQMTALQAIDLTRGYFLKQERTEAEFVIAFFGPSGAQHGVVHLHGRSPFPPFELYIPPIAPGSSFSWIWMGPEVTLTPHDYIAPDGQIDFQTLGLDMVERMRRQAGSVGDQIEQYHLIGGGIDYTIVDMSGVRTIRLADWPDQLGQHINPDQE